MTIIMLPEMVPATNPLTDIPTTKPKTVLCGILIPENIISRMIFKRCVPHHWHDVTSQAHQNYIA